MATLKFNFEMNSIQQIYIGKLDGCTCGCAGYYIHTQEFSDKRFAKDGIRLHADDKKVKQIIDEMAEQDLSISAWKDEIQFRTKGTDGYILFIKTDD